jgi:hypothetical protein
MGRMFSLLGMMVFTLGVFALASSVPTPAAALPPPPADDNDPPRIGGHRFETQPALAFHARFSLN